MRKIPINDIEKELLLKLSVSEDRINSNKLTDKEEDKLQDIRRCIDYLKSKYKKEFKILFYSPYNIFNLRSKLAFTDESNHIFFVYDDYPFTGLKDDYYSTFIADRYDKWILSRIRNEANNEIILKTVTRFPAIFGKDVNGFEDIETLVAMGNEFLRDVDIYISTDADVDEIKNFILNFDLKYDLYGFYRILKDDKELAYFSDYRY